MPSGISGPLSPARRVLRSRKGVAVRLGRTEEANKLDAEIRAARLENYIQRTVDEAPPLSVAQRAKLAAILLAPEAETAAELQATVDEISGGAA